MKDRIHRQNLDRVGDVVRLNPKLLEIQRAFVVITREKARSFASEAVTQPLPRLA